ncbi:MAG TPA: hypothetical protein VFI48_13700 [Hyphomicrobiaceae bacterium]|nr:hypothetical protein [Hyphomicrobiaceae bacterium]
MLDLRNRVGVRRWVADFALAFVLFWAAALGFGVAHSRAYAVPLPVLGREVVTPDAGPSDPAMNRAMNPAMNPASLRASEQRPTVGHATQQPEPSPEHARLLLSLAFATLAAMNLGFWRHLRRVYASPRRRVGRWG